MMFCPFFNVLLQFFAVWDVKVISVMNSISDCACVAYFALINSGIMKILIFLLQVCVK